MTKAAEHIACPVCGSELTLAQLFVHQDTQRAFAVLASKSVPLGARVLRYVTLFAPPKTRLTVAKQVKLILQLLPDIEREAITHKGRDWPAPLPAWSNAIDHMLDARALGRLDLPMTGHGYLYAILAGMADKHEARAEQQAEHDRRVAPQRDTVQVRGQTLLIGEALQVAYGGKDPALAEIDARTRAAAPMPPDVRERLAQLRKGKP